MEPLAEPIEITQRDLRNRSKEIMDGVEQGSTYTVTRGGREIGSLVPLPRRRRFVPRGKFTAVSDGVPAVNLDAFRADQEAAVNDELNGAHG